MNETLRRLYEPKKKQEQRKKRRNRGNDEDWFHHEVAMQKLWHKIKGAIKKLCGKTQWSKGWMDSDVPDEGDISHLLKTLQKQ